MIRVRITACRNPNDPSEDLRRLVLVRRDLYAHSPVEVDPDNPAFQTRRDADRNAYFEFSTDFLPEVHRVLRQFGHADHVRVEEVEGPVGEPCSRCGYIAGPVSPTVCPNCHFREIAPCPYCHEEVPRQSYLEHQIAGNLFVCPKCGNRVRMEFNEPFCLRDGTVNQPVVLVEEAV